MVSKRGNAIITFDYEVFLGKETGTIENSILSPTDKILNILKKNNAKAIFFIDATWLLFLQKHFPKDLALISKQLQKIIQVGSSVELHLHPQWLDASVSDGKIEFPTLKHYKLGSLEEEEILSLFDEGIELLHSVTNREISCFRAGGWSIEPFEKVKKAFEKNSIAYDFSVLPGVSLKEGEEFDFSFHGYPELPFYRFEDDLKIPVTDGRFVEFPLSIHSNNPLYRLCNKVLLKLNKDIVFGDGKGSKVKSVDQTIIQALKFSKGKLSTDRTSLQLFKYLLFTHFHNKGLITVVSHPKILSKQSLSILNYLTKRYTTYNAEDLREFTEQHIY